MARLVDMAKRVSVFLTESRIGMRMERGKGWKIKNPLGQWAERIFFSDSYRIQTCNLLIRSQMLYSVELANRLLGFASAKLGLLFESAKFFGIFFEQN